VKSWENALTFADIQRSSMFVLVLHVACRLLFVITASSCKISQILVIIHICKKTSYDWNCVMYQLFTTGDGIEIYNVVLIAIKLNWYQMAFNFLIVIVYWLNMLYTHPIYHHKYVSHTIYLNPAFIDRNKTFPW
jgi:hypothetical protein